MKAALKIPWAQIYDIKLSRAVLTVILHIKKEHGRFKQAP